MIAALIVVAGLAVVVGVVEWLIRMEVDLQRQHAPQVHDYDHY